MKKKIALLDFGLKKNIYRELVKRGAEVTVCPCTTTAQEIAAMGVDGIMLSNGPGDPAVLDFEAGEIAKMLGAKPILGVCSATSFSRAPAGRRRRSSPSATVARISLWSNAPRGAAC